MSKPKVIKEFDALDDIVKQAIFQTYPYGFERQLITFKNHKNNLISALPFETEEKFYMVKMTRSEANEISSNQEEIENDILARGMDDDDDDELDGIDEIEGIDDMDDMDD